MQLPRSGLDDMSMSLHCDEDAQVSDVRNTSRHITMITQTPDAKNSTSSPTPKIKHKRQRKHPGNQVKSKKD